MEEYVFSYLEKKYRYLNNHIRDFDTLLFTSPHSVIIKGRMFVENLTQETAKLEGYGLLNMMIQLERLRKLKDDGVFNDDTYELFHNVEIIGNKAMHSDIEGNLEVDLESALNIHKNIYKITCWFVNKYIDCAFEETSYERPIPSLKGSSNVDMEIINKVINKIDQMDGLTTKVQQTNKNDIKGNNSYNQEKILDRNYESEDAFEDFMIQSILDNEELNKKCLVQELARLKEASKDEMTK